MGLEASPYLSELLSRFGAPGPGDMGAAIKAVSHATADELPELKARFNLGWATKALLSDCDYDGLGRLQSAFADSAIQRALNLAWTDAKLPGDPVGVFILGLGKLGGHDLNFSSDIDLIAFFDPETVPVSQAKGQAYVLGKMMKRLTQILTPRGRPDFVYRVDWRLRPEASVTGLVMSVPRALDFYFFRALPWHRLALIKARIVAGDRALGEAFLDDLTPYLWRQNLDFRTIDELAALKRRITLEHPRLKAERAAREPILDTPTGFNVKLGAGGIREIEFIANAQQMIWGGKQYGLRTTHTRTALQQLGETGLLPAHMAATLDSIYVRHRRSENALQMMHNAQDHVLGDTDEALAPIAELLGQPQDNWAQQITRDRHVVHDQFEAMFEADNGETPEPVTRISAPMSDTSATIIEDWRSGFRRYNIRASKRDRLRPLSEALMRFLADVADIDEVVRGIDRFLGSLSRSEQYLTLLANRPALLGALINPLIHSPHMRTLLEQSPHIIETFLSPVPNDPAFVLAEPDYETRLERLRRFVNEGLFQSYHAFLSGQTTWQDLAGALTQQAETALETALFIARDDLEAPELKIAVLGLGKLGQARMAPQSDLDLIFLFDDAVDRDLAAKAVRRLSTILTMPMKEGIAYELDMRLRPSGRAGPAAVTLSAFKSHHEKTARTWEHIALVPARIVAGDPELGAAVTQEIEYILSRPRDPDQLWADANDMWDKIAGERIRPVPPERFATKLRNGGLMMADFWTAVFEMAGEPGLLEAQDGWTHLLYWERLLGLTDRSVGSVPSDYHPHLPADLQAYHETLIQTVLSRYDERACPRDVQTFRPVTWAG